MSAKRPREALTLEFPDNALLAGLSGAHQKHFVRLEQTLSVRLAQRGNLVSVEGAGRERAAQVLRALYARLEAGEHVGTADSNPNCAFPKAASIRSRRALAHRRSRPGRGIRRGCVRRPRPLISI